MGSQFWWFYDIIAAAIILICIFISAKKGALKSAISAVSYIIVVALAFGISTGAANSLYTNTMRSSNIRKIDKVLKSSTFTSKYSLYLESLGYNIRPSEEKLNEIFTKSDAAFDEALVRYINSVNGRKLMEEEEALEAVREGYAVVIRDIVALNQSKYVSETAAKEIRRDSSGMQELIPLITDKDDRTPAAKYIADNYTAPAFVTIFKLAGFIILFIILGILMYFIDQSITREREASGMATRICGGFIGIAMGCVFVFTAAAVVRLWAILGSNEMLFFNNDVIDKSLVFKYFYSFIP